MIPALSLYRGAFSNGNGLPFLIGCLLDSHPCGGGVDMPAGDLRTRQRIVGQLGYVILQTAVRDLSRNGAGHSFGPAGHRGDGLPRKGGPIPGGDSSKGPSHKAHASAQAHTGAALHHRVSHIGISFEFTGKSRREGTGSCPGTGGGGTGGGPGSTKHSSSTFPTASQAAEDPGGHDHFHGHAGPCLGHVQAHGRQVAVKLLGGFEKRQRAEQPEEHRTPSAGKRPAIADELPHRAVKGPEKPDIEHQKQKLGPHHPAPGLEHLAGGLGAAHGVGQGAGVTQDSHHNVALYTLQQELEVIPAQSDEQNEN